jgi:endonuclease/exonuclease/phosphatase family metal-dependent hydrolase
LDLNGFLDNEEAMALRICTYNIEWFTKLFRTDNTLRTGQSERKQQEAIRDVMLGVGTDLIGIVEAPNHKDAAESTVAKLENFAQWAGLSTTAAMIGFPSVGQQELAVLYDPAKFTVTHTPGGNAASEKNPPFTGQFFFDTDEDRIKERYEFYRPPLEARVQVNASGEEFHLIVAHTKSKGMFNAADLVHWRSESERNRRKLFAECTWVRNRVDEWLADGRQVVVMGDINDGPGMDHYEQQFGRSAVEIIMGSLFEPASILRYCVPKPKWGAHGWEPSSARFQDRFTHDHINVLIDHILVSQGLPLAAGNPHKIWNPFQDQDAKPLKKQLLDASDHFPVTLDIALGP